VVIDPHFSPDGKVLTLSLNPQEIFLSQKYTRLFHFFGKSLVNPNTCVTILPTGEKYGLKINLKYFLDLNFFVSIKKPLLV